MLVVYNECQNATNKYSLLYYLDEVEGCSGVKV